jgi:hypothetical protein
MLSDNTDHERHLPTRLAIDYYGVLSRTIEAAKFNSRHLREAVYNLARVHLQREILSQYPNISAAQLQRLLSELEDAIERVEATHAEAYDNNVFRAAPPTAWAGASEEAANALRASDEDWAPPSGAAVAPVTVYAPQAPMAVQHGPVLQVLPDYLANRHLPSVERFPTVERRPTMRPSFGVFVQNVASALLAVATFAFMTGHWDVSGFFSKSKPTTAASLEITAAKDQVALPAVNAAPSEAVSTVLPAAQPPTAVAPAYPVPQSYGVYALVDGALIELDRLGMRVPDARVLISPEIREPSRVVLPNGNVSFIVYRREMAGAAPDRMSVRVVAKVESEMAFKDGKPQTKAVENSWRIRSQAFDFKVAPINENRDMVLAKAEPELVLPAGRYALVMAGQGYDFSVAGPVTDRQQCLERIETVQGAMYSECRKQGGTR